MADQHLADTPGLAALAAACVRTSTAEPPQVGLLTQALSELVAGAPHQGALLGALDGLLAGQLPDLVATCLPSPPTPPWPCSSPEPSRGARPTEASGVLNHLPEHSVAMVELAAELTAQAVVHYRGQAEVDDKFLAQLASLLENLSVRLAASAREEALAAIEEAVAIRLGLAAAGPDAFLPSVASLLNNLSNRLSDLGRREEASAAIEEAVSIYLGAVRRPP